MSDHVYRLSEIVGSRWKFLEIQGMPRSTMRSLAYFVRWAPPC